MRLGVSAIPIQPETPNMARELRMGELNLKLKVRCSPALAAILDRVSWQIPPLAQVIVRRSAELHVHRVARSTRVGSRQRWASILTERRTLTSRSCGYFQRLLYVWSVAPRNLRSPKLNCANLREATPLRRDSLKLSLIISLRTNG
jgi:hypothetical protein